LIERIWASRVREICMHGLKRAEAVEQSAPPLLDFPSVQSLFAHARAIPDQRVHVD
jgi:hypothetical protein